MRNNRFVPPFCESCNQRIWNPEFFGEDSLGMCGPCTTGESATLFHEEWVPPPFELVNSDKKLLAYWQDWYENEYLQDDEVMVDAQCQTHKEGPACWPCSVHAMLMGQDTERERIIELLEGMKSDAQPEFGRIIDTLVEKIKLD